MQANKNANSGKKQTFTEPKTFGQLNLGDKLYQVSEAGLEEINVDGIHYDALGDFNRHVVITSGERRFKQLKNDVTGMYAEGYSCSQTETFVSTSKQKAAVYLSLVKPYLIERVEKTRSMYYKLWSEAGAKADNLQK